MSSIANIVAFDGQSTPVSHTFLADRTWTENGIAYASYKESLGGVPEYAQARVIISKRKLGKRVMRTAVRVEVPVMESINGQNSSGYTAAPEVAYTDVTEVVNYSHDRSVTAGRRGCRQLALNIAGSVATSVAPVTSGPVPEAMDQNVMPT